MTTAVIRTILNYKNYDDWSSEIKTYLLAEDLWDIIDEGTDEGPKTEDEEKAQSKFWKKKDAKALYAIQNSCGDDTYKLIKYKTTAKQAWDTLSDTLEKPGEPSNEKANMSIGEAYPTLTADNTTPEDPMEEGRVEGAGHDEIQETFVKYVESNDWDSAIKFLRQHPQAASYTFPLMDGGTVLHYAISSRCSERIIQQLVELMDNGHLEITNFFGSTALYDLISLFPERFRVAEYMVKKNPNLLTILPRFDRKALTILPELDQKAPVVVAQETTKAERMACSLYSLTPPKTLKVIDAAQLISDGFRLQRFDIVWDLIQRYPKLAMDTDHDRNIPLGTLANNRFAFKSGSSLSFWKKWIYDGIHIKPLPTINTDSRINVDQGPQAEQQENKRHHLIYSGISLFRRLVVNLQTLLGIDHIYQMKLVHERIQQFLPLMCKVVRQEDMDMYQTRKLKEALFMAAEQGHVEYITHFLRFSSYPVLGVWNEKNQSLFQIAAECRKHNVYNFICEFYRKLDKNGLDGSKYGLLPSEGLKEAVKHKDNLGNNMLHTVARITPLSQIDHIQGATLQMQRELQWFKGVENIADPKDCESINIDNETPRKIFIENHKELGKEAEKSMKETANSCTIVSALIVTLMFAAAFTVPDENDKNDEKTYHPTFLTNRIIFIVSDTISLFSSTISIIMFSGIFTSRYSQDDFYKVLPTKMIIGLYTLCLSVTTMLIAFSIALYMILDSSLSILIISILLTCVSIVSFTSMQYRLALELFFSTFERGIFDRKQKKLF